MKFERTLNEAYLAEVRRRASQSAMKVEEAIGDPGKTPDEIAQGLRRGLDAILEDERARRVWVEGNTVRVAVQVVPNWRK